MTNKEDFFERMNEEMSKPHSNFEDVVHNWLCTQKSNEELVQGVMQEGKSISSACNFVIEQAKKQSDGRVAAVEDSQVWGWVTDYFTGTQTEVKGNPRVTVKPSEAKQVEKPKKIEVKSTPKTKEMLSIFDFIDETGEEDDEESDLD